MAKHNTTQHNGTYHNILKRNDTQYNGTQHNDTMHNDTQHNDSIMTLSMTPSTQYNESPPYSIKDGTQHKITVLLRTSKQPL